jgi:archaellum biogenesis protein FlaJ (TadC family)
MKITAALFVMVAFLVIVVGILAVIGPSAGLSIIYILFAALFATALINIIRGKTYITKTTSPKRPAKKWIFVIALINFLGGVVAFIVYWITKNHLAAVRTLTIFTSLSLLLFIFSGGRIESQ